MYIFCRNSAQIPDHWSVICGMFRIFEDFNYDYVMEHTFTGILHVAFDKENK